jgi:serine/threonine-protein phosphatase 2A activator
VDLIDQLSKQVDDIPPLAQQQRFGNHAFKTWFKKLSEVKLICSTGNHVRIDETMCFVSAFKQSIELTRKCLTAEYENYADEICVYLNDAFGNGTRIDYGTGTYV